MTVDQIPSDQFEELLRLIQEFCSKSQILTLLRSAKGSKGGATLSGTKEQLALVHLRNALSAGAVVLDDVFNALRSAEENGNQHIFFYRAGSRAIRRELNDAHSVAATLIEKRFTPTSRFPMFLPSPKGVVWADFRVDSKDANGQSWTAKLYAGIEHPVLVEERTEGKRFIRVYEQRLLREIYLIKWHSSGMLQLRVPRGASSKAVLQSLYELWGIMERAAGERDFEHIDLTVAANTLLREADSLRDYRLGSVEFLDSNAGTIRLLVNDPDDELLSNAMRQRAVKVFSACRELAVVWRLDEVAGSDVPDLPRELRTVIGSIRSNELLVPSKTTDKALDYVTQRLWTLAGSAS